MSKRRTNKKKMIPGDFVGAVLSTWTGIFLMILVVIFSFYHKEGYYRLATAKFTLFKTAGLYMGIPALAAGGIGLGLTLLGGAKDAPDQGGRKGFAENLSGLLRSLSITDLSVLFYLLILFISYECAFSKEEAGWGTSGWYMGFFTQMIFLGIYYFVSRYYSPKMRLLPIIMCTVFVIFSWGILNRFSIFPIDMPGFSPEYLACMGNINWLCGYWSVLYSVGVVSYYISEKSISGILSGLSAAAGIGLGIVEGSDSAFLAFGATFLLLFWFAFTKTRYMLRFWELVILYSGICQGFHIWDVLKPESLNYRTEMMDLMFGPITLGILAAAVGMRILCAGVTGEAAYAKIGWLRYLVFSLLALLFVLYLVLLRLNTVSPGSIGSWSAHPMFIYDEHWGSGRSVIWKDGLIIFQSLPTLHKMIGVGPDCFAIYAYYSKPIAKLLETQFAEGRLTNAHNELLTLLVNVGILGTTGFLTAFLSNIVRLGKNVRREPECMIFMACLIAYLVHNQVSFEQILNTPFAFLMLGLGENRLRTLRKQA